MNSEQGVKIGFLNVGIGGGFGIIKVEIWGGFSFLFGGVAAVGGGCGCFETVPGGAGFSKGAAAAGGKCLDFGKGGIFGAGTGGSEGLLRVGADAGGKILDFGKGGGIVGGSNFLFLCGGMGGGIGLFDT